MYLNEEDQPRNRDFYMDRTREINELVGYINYLENSISQIMQNNQSAQDFINDEIGRENFFNRLQDAKDKLREAKRSLDIHRETREQIEGRYYEDMSFHENEEKRNDGPQRNLANDNEVRMKFLELQDVVKEFEQKLNKHQENMELNFDGSSKYSYCDELLDLHDMSKAISHKLDDCYYGLKQVKEQGTEALKNLSLYIAKAQSGINMIDSMSGDFKKKNSEFVHQESKKEDRATPNKDFVKIAEDLVRRKCSPKQAKEFEEELKRNQGLSDTTRAKTMQKLDNSTQDEQMKLAERVARNFCEYGKQLESTETNKLIVDIARNTNITEEEIVALCNDVLTQYKQSASANVPEIVSIIKNFRQQTKE